MGNSLFSNTSYSSTTQDDENLHEQTHSTLNDDDMEYIQETKLMNNYVAKLRQNVKQFKRNFKFGWKKDMDHNNDRYLQNKEVEHIKPFIRVDLQKKFDHVLFNQGSLKSSTVCCVLTAFLYDHIKAVQENFVPSILFVYYNALSFNDHPIVDCGATFRQVFRAINKYGICNESTWPTYATYLTTPPSRHAYHQADFFKRSLVFQRIDNTNLLMLKSLLSLGRPFIFGFALYDNFCDDMIWNPAQDNMPYPSKTNKRIGFVTGIAVGYSDNRQCIIVQMSWGSSFGNKGRFFMPYKYITNKQFCDEFYYIKREAVDTTTNTNTNTNINEEAITNKYRVRYESEGDVNMIVNREEEEIQEEEEDTKQHHHNNRRHRHHHRRHEEKQKRKGLKVQNSVLHQTNVYRNQSSSSPPPPRQQQEIIKIKMNKQEQQQLDDPVELHLQQRKGLQFIDEDDEDDGQLNNNNNDQNDYSEENY